MINGDTKGSNHMTPEASQHQTPSKTDENTMGDYRARLISGLEVRLIFGDTTDRHFGAVPHKGVILCDTKGYHQIGWIPTVLWDAAPIHEHNAAQLLP